VRSTARPRPAGPSSSRSVNRSDFGSFEKAGLRLRLFSFVGFSFAACPRHLSRSNMAAQTGATFMPGKTIDHAFTATSLTSAATDPTYAGALSFMRRRFGKDIRGADVVVWGIPFDAATSNRPGARFGPQAIRRASAIFDNDPQYPFGRDLFAQMAVVDYGDCLLDYGNHQETPATIEREAGRLIADGAFLLTLGGDHFITWPL